MSENNSLSNVELPSILDEIKSLGAKVLSDIEKARNAHSNWWDVTKDEFASMKEEIATLAHQALDKVEPLILNQVEDEATVDLVDEITNLTQSKVDVSAFVKVAVALIKKASTVDENAKQQFESLYNQ